jgi:hypothetical protein
VCEKGKKQAARRTNAGWVTFVLTTLCQSSTLQYTTITMKSVIFASLLAATSAFVPAAQKVCFPKIFSSF